MIPNDPEVIDALAARIGHGPPFTGEDLATVDSVTFYHCKELPDFSAFPSLGFISLRGCAVESLDFVRHLPKLWYLSISYARLRSIEPLAQVHTLETLQLKSCFVQDLRPIEQHPSLEDLSVHGAPLDDHSYHQIIPRFARLAEERGWGEGERDSEEDWQLTRALFERGIEATYHHGKGGWGVLAVPGPGFFLDEPAHQLGQATPDELREALEDPDLTLESLWERFAIKPFKLPVPTTPESAEPAGASVEDQVGKVVGGAQQALAWLETAPVSAQERFRLYALVSRFPALSWQRFEDPDAADPDGVMPGWYRERVRHFDGPAFEDAEHLWLSFDEAAFPFEGNLYDSGRPFCIQPFAQRLGRLGQRDLARVREAGLYPFADDTTQVLALRHDPDDQAVYVFDLTALTEDEPLSGAYAKAFASLAHMWSHVKSVHAR